MSAPSTSSIPPSLSTSSTTNLLNSRKRKPDEPNDPDEPPASLPRYYYVLAPESDQNTEEDTESVHSVQDKPTDSVKDTSDLSYSSDDLNIIYRLSGTGGLELIGRRDSLRIDGTVNRNESVEYEPLSMSEREMRHPYTLQEVFSSSADSDIVPHRPQLNFVGTAENVSSTFSSSSENPVHVDVEMSWTDYWTCVRCRNRNNNPLFRYCEKCWGDRKNFYPPRPKPRRKRVKQRKRRSVRKNASDTKSIESSPTAASRNETTSVSTITSSQLPTNETASVSRVTQSTSLQLSVSEAGSSHSISKLYSGSEFRAVPSTSTATTDVKPEKSTNGEFKSIDSSTSTVKLSQNECISDSINNKLSQNESNESNYLTCSTCMCRPKDGLFIHGSTAHLYSCFHCSKKIWRGIGRCPLCNAKVSNVLKLLW